MEELIKLKETIKNNKVVLIYFSSTECNVCHALKPKVFSSIKDKYPHIKLIEIDISNSVDISSYFNILSAPTVIVLFEGKEFIRKVRNFGVEELSNDIKRPYNILFS